MTEIEIPFTFIQCAECGDEVDEQSMYSMPDGRKVCFGCWEEDDWKRDDQQREDAEENHA